MMHRSPKRSRTACFAAIALAASGLASGCSSNEAPARTDLTWPWWPNRMQITDITRVGRPDAAGVRPIEIRIRFQDPDGDATKALGTLDLTVSRLGEREDPVEVSIDLEDPAIQRDCWERVTECYWIPIRVDLPGLVEGRMLRIEADYRGVDGTVLRDRFDLVLDAPLRSGPSAD